MVWIHDIAERSLDLQNPTSPDKLRLLGRRIKLAPGKRVLDLGSGRGGPATLFATEFGCELTCVEFFTGFTAVARERAQAAGVSHRIRIVETDASKFPIESGRYDVAMCLGASFIFGGTEATLDALSAGVGPGGHVVLGEVYDTRSEDQIGPNDQTLAQLLSKFEDRGLRVLTFIRSSQDDWDRYVTGRVAGILDWIDDNPDHPEIEKIREFRRPDYEEYVASEFQGWVIVVGRKSR